MQTKINLTDSTENGVVPTVAMTIHFPVSAKSFVLPQVKRLIESGVPAELWVEDAPKYREFTRALDCPIRLLSCSLSLNPWKLLGRFRGLCRAIKASGIKAIHCHQTRAAVLPLLAAKWMGVKTRVYQNHGLPYLGYRGLRRWVLRSIELVNIWAATDVLLVSHSNLAAARADGLLSHDRGTVLHQGSAMGVDLDRFRLHGNVEAIANARESFGLGRRTEDVIFGYVGRPVARKGFHLTLQAWNLSRLGTAGSRLLVAGCTAEECAAAGGKLEGVVPLGYISDMGRFYAACDVVVLPSDHEGFPTAMLEASAAGRATIGADVPGTRCAVLDGITGVLVPPKDAEKLRDAMLMLAKNREKRLELAAGGKRRVEQHFQSEIVLDALLDYYHSVLGLTVPGVEITRFPSRKVA